MALLILVPLIGTALLLPGLARSTGEFGVFRISEPSQWVVLVAGLACWMSLVGLGSGRLRGARGVFVLLAVALPPVVSAVTGALASRSAANLAAEQLARAAPVDIIRILRDGAVESLRASYLGALIAATLIASVVVASAVNEWPMGTRPRFGRVNPWVLGAAGSCAAGALAVQWATTAQRPPLAAWALTVLGVLAMGLAGRRVDGSTDERASSASPSFSTLGGICFGFAAVSVCQQRWAEAVLGVFPQLGGEATAWSEKAARLARGWSEAEHDFHASLLVASPVAAAAIARALARALASRQASPLGERVRLVVASLALATIVTLPVHSRLAGLRAVLANLYRGADPGDIVLVRVTPEHDLFYPCGPDVVRLGENDIRIDDRRIAGIEELDSNCDRVGAYARALGSDLAVAAAASTPYRHVLCLTAALAAGQRFGASDLPPLTHWVAIDDRPVRRLSPPFDRSQIANGCVPLAPLQEMAAASGPLVVMTQEAWELRDGTRAPSRWTGTREERLQGLRNAWTGDRMVLRAAPDVPLQDVLAASVLGNGSYPTLLGPLQEATPPIRAEGDP
jgi:hypothetical protein